jgi:ribosomal protein S18 acetylase RimI-like enzyme
MIQIRKAQPKDHEAIWLIIREVLAGGDTYVFDPDSSREEMLEYWCGPDTHCYVAEIDAAVLGTFIIKDNFPDLGAHVANGSYMTLPSAFGKGIGRTMGEFSLKEARKLGYRAMQFNIVVKHNERAIRLWQNLGFKIIGEIPEAFYYRKERYVDACIMWRSL